MDSLQRLVAAALAASLAAACTQGQSGLGSAQEQDQQRTTPAAATPAPTRTVSGSKIDNYVSDRGEVQHLADLSSAQINALVQDASGNTTVIPGTGTSSGTFTIPNVPVGSYLLQFNNTYLATSAGRVDLGSDLAGRPDSIFPQASTTALFSLRGLDPFAAAPGGGALQFFSPSTNAYLFMDDQASANGINPGDTTTNSLAIDWTGSGNALVDSEAGDTAYIYQLSPRTSSAGAPYFALSKNFSPDPIRITEGTTTTISGVCDAVPQNNKLTLPLWSVSQFASQQASVNPKAVSDGQGLVLDAQPFTALLGSTGASPDLISAAAPAGSATDIAFGEMPYGNPFPCSWPLFGSAFANFHVDVTAPGATSASPLFGGVSAIETASRFSAAPVVTPLTAVKVAGRDAFGNLTGVGLTPTISWSAPAVGEPGFVRVALFQVSAVTSGGTRLHRIKTFATAGTQLTVPAGVLTAGATYVLRLQATLNGNVDFAKHPFRTAYPMARADVITSVLAP